MCKECPIACGSQKMLVFGRFEYYGRYLKRVDCPLVAVDKFGDIDFEANGWPEVTPFYGSEDTSNMPKEIHDYWLDLCDIAEWQWETA